MELIPFDPGFLEQGIWLRGLGDLCLPVSSSVISGKKGTGTGRA